MNQKRSQQLIKKKGGGGDPLAFHIHEVYCSEMTMKLLCRCVPSAFHGCSWERNTQHHLKSFSKGTLQKEKRALWAHQSRPGSPAGLTLWNICSAAWILRIVLLKVASATSSVFRSSVTVASATPECWEHDLPPGDLGSASVGNLKLERGPTECRIMSTLEGMKGGSEAARRKRLQRVQGAERKWCASTRTSQVLKASAVHNLSAGRKKEMFSKYNLEKFLNGDWEISRPPPSGQMWNDRLKWMQPFLWTFTGRTTKLCDSCVPSHRLGNRFSS